MSLPSDIGAAEHISGNIGNPFLRFSACSLINAQEKRYREMSLQTLRRGFYKVC